jgi:hypothetical protein
MTIDTSRLRVVTPPEINEHWISAADALTGARLSAEGLRYIADGLMSLDPGVAEVIGDLASIVVARIKRAEAFLETE